MGSIQRCPMSTKKDSVVVYTWAIPKGALFKIIKKEYKYLSKAIDTTIFVTSEPVPEVYEEEFREINGISLSNGTCKSKDMSFYFPGLEMSIEGGIFTSIRRAYAFLRRANPRTILAHQLLSALIILPFSLNHRIRLVIVLHDNPFMFMEHNTKKRRGLKNLLLMNIAYQIEKITLKRSNCVICTTSHIKESVINHIGQTENMIVADLGIDAFPRVNEKNRTILLTVSKWSRFRKPEKYLEILKYLPEDISLTVAGRWDSVKDLSKFVSSVNSMGLNDRVETISELTENGLSELYNRAKVFLRLGFNETGTGLGILEAIGHGCPVVVSQGLGASEIVRDGVNGFVVNENEPKEIAQRITEIYANNALFNSMSDAAYRLAESTGWGDHFRKVLQSIKS